ncbi:MAG: BON domain-containing protein [Candidatus Sericytochromatia bacterium]|nr:BON domain-containing protein [Candidatus Sericytochromatia bacterium]
MGWFSRLFGTETPENASTNPEPQTDGGTITIPAERVGPQGEFDQSGLAKRVALAFDQDATVADVDTVWVAQTGGTVVLKGTAPSDEILAQMVTIARGINGATSVETDQVTIG